MCNRRRNPNNTSEGKASFMTENRTSVNRFEALLNVKCAVQSRIASCNVEQLY